MSTFINAGVIIGIVREKENTLLNIHNKSKDVEYSIRVIEKLSSGKQVEVKLYDTISWDGTWAYVAPSGENKGIIEPIKIPKIENKVLENVRY